MVNGVEMGQELIL
jgi:hypothetical protein